MGPQGNCRVLCQEKLAIRSGSRHTGNCKGTVHTTECLFELTVGTGSNLTSFCVVSNNADPGYVDVDGRCSQRERLFFFVSCARISGARETIFRRIFGEVIYGILTHIKALNCSFRPQWSREQTDTHACTGSSWTVWRNKGVSGMALWENGWDYAT